MKLEQLEATIQQNIDALNKKLGNINLFLHKPTIEENNGFFQVSFVLGVSQSLTFRSVDDNKTGIIEYTYDFNIHTELAYYEVLDIPTSVEQLNFAEPRLILERTDKDPVIFSKKAEDAESMSSSNDTRDIEYTPYGVCVTLKLK